MAFVLCYVTAIKTPTKFYFISIFKFRCLAQIFVTWKKGEKKYYFSYSIKGKHLSLMIVVAAACLQHAKGKVNCEASSFYICHN